MTYESRVNELIKVMEHVAAEALTSEPRTSWCSFGPNPSKYQFATWSEENKSKVRLFVRDYISVVGRIRYKQSSMFLMEDEGDKWTAPLATMLLHMCGDRDSNPEYIIDNINRLLQSLETHKEQYSATDFNNSMVKAMTEEIHHAD